MRNEARRGLLAHVAQTRFCVALHTAISNPPSVHVVHGIQAATVICWVAVE